MEAEPKSESLINLGEILLWAEAAGEPVSVSMTFDILDDASADSLCDHTDCTD